MRVGWVAAGVALWVVVGCGRTGYGHASLLDGDGGSGDGSSGDRSDSPDPNGSVRDEPLFVGDPVPVASGDAIEPCLEWTGSDFGLAWAVDGESKKSIMFRRLDAAGTPIGSPIEVASRSTDYLGQPDLVWTGSQFGLVWRQGTTTEVWFVRIDANGQIIEAPARLSADDGAISQVPTVAWDGTSFVVAWDDYGTGALRAVWSTISPGGNVISGPTKLFDPDLADSSYAPELTWVGGGFFVAWAAGYGFGECAVSPWGQPVTDVVVLEPYIARPVAASIGDPSFGVAWRTVAGELGSRFARMNADGEIIGEIIPILDGKSANEVHIAALDSEYVVAVSRADDGFYASRFDASGNLLVHEARIGDGLPPQAHADLSPADGGYAVVWQDGAGGIQFRRFNP